MKKRFCSLLLFCIVFTLSAAAQTEYYFYVQFSDKNNSPYSLSNPSAYLSARAIERRNTFGISCDSTDLPVNPSYINQMSIPGIKLHSRSKWMNGVTVLVGDSSLMQQVRALPFVKWVQYSGQLNISKAARKKTKATEFNYGTATTQINQLNGSHLHSNGFTGQNIHIGVLDAGFANVDVNSGFDSLRTQGRLLGTKDIIFPGNNVFAEDYHGAQVLSVMAANLQDQFVGTAPHASYWLIRTEYDPTEYLVETDFWVAGVEFADSVGVDVINSSLAYTVFDDPSMDFSYADMNGKVSRASRVATMAAQKGIVVCNSAGNDGSKSWRYIGSPADAEKIFTVGSVTQTGAPSYFSSFGPSADNRTKPDLCAMGSASSVLSAWGSITTNNGTSFSSPIMAGMLACLLQRYKSFDPQPNLDVFYNAVIQSCNLHDAPTTQMGYGIPDFLQAEMNLPLYNAVDKIDDDNDRLVDITVYPDQINIRKRIDNPSENYSASVYSSNGSIVSSTAFNNESTFIPTIHLVKGIYAITVTSGKKVQTQKIAIR